MACYYVQNAIGLLDNGNDTQKRIDINNYCCDYLYKHYSNIDKKELIYDKWRVYEENDINTTRKV